MKKPHLLNIHIELTYLGPKSGEAGKYVCGAPPESLLVLANLSNTEGAIFLCNEPTLQWLYKFW